MRRACYSVTSVGARGARWEWARLTCAQHALLYEPMPMEVSAARRPAPGARRPRALNPFRPQAQCRLEEAWAAGADSVAWEGWAVSLAHMTARAGGASALRLVRLVRRAPQPPYPLARSPAAQPPTPPARTPVEGTRPPPPPPLAREPSRRPAHGGRAPLPGRRPRIPQQHTGSSVHSVQSLHSVRSVQSAQSVQSAPARHTTRSVSPKDRKPGLARQILHNLNIFSNYFHSIIFGYLSSNPGVGGVSKITFVTLSHIINTASKKV